MLFPESEDESARIAALRRLKILDTPPENDFDDLTRLAAQICRVPIALISLVDEDRQWFKSKIGLDESETPRAFAFCQHTIAQKTPLIIRDARRDERFKENPLVKEKPFIRFYAGFPLISVEGYALGTINVIDVVPRELSFEQLEALQTIARQATALLQLRESSLLLAETNRRLKLKEENYRIVAESASDMIITVADDNMIIFVNPAAEKILGYSPQELIGKSLLTIIPARFHAGHLGGMRRFLETGVRRIPWNGLETLASHRDGHEVAIEISFGEYRDNDKRAFTAVIRDITERKRIETALRESEEHYRFLAEASPQQVWTALPDGRIDYLNGRALDYLGESSVYAESGWCEAAHTDDAPNCFEKWRHSLATGDNYNEEFRLKRRDGEFRWHLVQAAALRSKNGEIVKWFGTNTDIHEQKLAGEALRKSEEYHRSLFQLANDAIIIFCPFSEIIYDVNQKACSVYGIAREQFIGKNLKDLTHDVNRGEKQLDRLLKNGFYEEFETVHLRSDGSPIDILCNSSMIEYQGKPAVLSINRDISEQKKAEQILLETQRMLQLVLDTIPQAVFWKDRNSVFLGCNSVFARLAGGNSPQDIIGKTDYELPGVNQEQADFYRAYDERIMETGRGEFQVVAQIQIGEKKAWCSFSKVPLRNLNGEIIGVLATSEDITPRKHAEDERQKLEEQLLQSQKMESVGRLAGGVAHDFNNLLTVILSSIQLARLNSVPDLALSRRLEEIETAAERAASLTRQLLAFSRRQQLQRRNLNLNETISDTLRIIQRIIGEHIEVAFHLAPDLETIYADSSQIEQIVMNLSVNARDAMPEGGRLIIETRNVVLGEEYSRTHNFQKPGKYVQLQITDNGKGMSEDIVQHIFEPFFTTKEVGSGTGLGLSMVYGIVKQHEGGIDVYSEPGEGTTFKIYFPVQENKETILETAQGYVSRQGSETILIAEDEKALRELSKEILEQFGYKVMTAADGVEVVELFQKHQKEIDLVMLDLVMPRMGGIKAFEQIRAVNSAVPVIFMTGYSDKMFDSDLNKQFTETGKLRQAFLQKPYSVDSLSRIVREVLET